MRDHVRQFTTRLIVVAVVATGGFVTAGAMTSAHAASPHVVRISDHAHTSSPHTVWRGNTPWG
ncbi:hypothetical protein Skr01_40830 [Sphaerisporangium krabiense]|uniref:Uncharacterized protein n=1 Tax=Sphaerisporangium krabiense TaxID=763782 RepID=A0A7W8Z9E7_9ACTN|nr:hypothetical protein [Sphaerisporangium krabiense]MBB5629896.1 hypothetical protein [Sphaerisporangium krabiense]GII63998.1 hypothetical protein Skr01_40830 [Sphaerisporangium krabiense]